MKAILDAFRVEEQGVKTIGLHFFYVKKSYNRAKGHLKLNKLCHLYVNYM